MGLLTSAIVDGILAVLLLGAVTWLVILHRRVGKLQRHFSAISPEGFSELDGRLREIGGDARLALTRGDVLASRYDALHEQLKTTLQHVGVVRFNPFRDTGGDQSFAIALLDHEANGVVMSSLHNRSDTRVYAKPVQAGASPYTLSDEEQQAIAIAIRQVRPGEDAERLKELRSSRS